ncbi:MAG TPA: DinB family protein [Thermoanaerobaculia bacterium]|nr:DinB family protein [Thermoanaerobaculia bacterium]
MNWQRVLDTHSQAAKSLAEAAEQIPPEQWLTPRAEGKWSPGHVLQHLNQTYDVLLRELRGGIGMAVQTTLWQRMLLRLTVVPKILRGGWFPSGARAPREIRPAEPAADKDAAIAKFRALSKEFDSAAVKAQANGGQKLSHAYFGRSGVPDSVLLCTRHIEHHDRQLRSMTRTETAG